MAGTQRRLAAIVCADVVGYSRLVGVDEEGTLARLKALRRELIDPKVAEHRGRIVKTTGDGLLLEFASVVDAVRCVVETQTVIAARRSDKPLDRHIEFRFGVHMGDILSDGDDILGDGVNIAARLEALATPGGLCVSGRVREDLVGKLDVSFHDAGEQSLKNIARPVSVWHWSPTASPAVAVSSEAELALPDKPSIAVLPFTNLSGEPDQEFFTDGVTEDIITELSRFRSLFVIASNSSFSYKGKSPDIRQVGKQLGVRYVLEGSIRRAGNRIRVSGQLIDAPTGSHIWAERYDRVLEDIFAVQEELTRSIVRAIAPQIEAAELDKVRRRRPESLSAYEIAVRGWAKSWEAHIKSDRAVREDAIREARAALAIDARSSLALNALAYAQWQHILLGTAVDRDVTWREGDVAATRAIEEDRSDSCAYGIKGRLLAYAIDQDRIGDALTYSRRGYDLNPNNMLSLTGLALVEILAGNPESGIEHLHQALRMSPRDPQRYMMHHYLSVASVCSRDYANGVKYALLGIGEAPRFPLLHVMLANSYVGMGEIEKAMTALEEARRLGPEVVESRLAAGFPLRDCEHRLRAITFMRIAAGLQDPAAAEALR
jgi:adenylate cyclase